MGRSPKYPVELNDLMCLSIKKFTIKANTLREGIMTFKNMRMEFTLLVRENQGILRLNRNDEKWVIHLKPVKSNLELGSYFVFICPITKYTCKHLYFYNSQFQHRSNIPVNYSKQNEAKKNRVFERIIRYELGTIEDEMMKPYSRTHYRGQPTRRYLRILRTLEKEKEFYYSQMNTLIQESIKRNESERTKNNNCNARAPLR